MSNRAFLIQANTDRPGESFDDNDVLLGGSLFVPIFWYMLFDIDDVRRVPVEELETTIPYPIAKRHVARARIDERRPLALPHLPEAADQYLVQFAELIESAEGDYLHLEATEIWDLGDGFDDKLTAALHLVAGADASDAQWNDLLDEAEIGANHDPNLLIFSLAGYSWVRSVPWDP